MLGARGQDGALICKSLLQKNHEVIGLSKQNSSPSASLKRLGIEKDIDLKVGDVKDYTTIKNLINKYKPIEIYNLAGQSSVGLSFVKPLTTLESIVDVTRNILEASRKLSYDGNLFSFALICF